MRLFHRVPGVLLLQSRILFLSELGYMFYTYKMNVQYIVICRHLHICLWLLTLIFLKNTQFSIWQTAMGMNLFKLEVVRFQGIHTKNKQHMRTMYSERAVPVFVFDTRKWFGVCRTMNDYEAVMSFSRIMWLHFVAAAKS